MPSGPCMPSWPLVFSWPLCVLMAPRILMAPVCPHGPSCSHGLCVPTWPLCARMAPVCPHGPSCPHAPHVLSDNSLRPSYSSTFPQSQQNPTTTPATLIHFTHAADRCRLRSLCYLLMNKTNSGPDLEEFAVKWNKWISISKHLVINCASKDWRGGATDRRKYF